MFEKRRTDQAPETALAAEGIILIRECEDFLSGNLARDLISAGGTVPDWAWLNLLAHASEAELRIFAQEEYSEGLLSIYDAWRYAEYGTACAVLAASEACGCSVEEIQRCVLIPLELELATVNEISPDKFEAMVFDALNHYGAR